MMWTEIEPSQSLLNTYKISFRFIYNHNKRLDIKM